MAIHKYTRVIKVVLAIPLFALAAIAVLLGSIWLDHFRETPLPIPTGTFAVGRATYLWQDATHMDSLAPKAGTKRNLLAWIWYPAAPQQRGQAYDEYLPNLWRSALERQSSVLLTQFLTRDLSRVRVHSVRDADVSLRQRTYPVVLMRGGHSALTADYTSLAEDLASHGYVVVGFDVPYRTFVTVLPDGTVMSRAPQNNAEQVGGAEKVQLANKLVEAWSADMRFALDQLEQMSASDSSSRFYGRLDMNRVGAFGHSLGGAEALQFCHDDPRCKAGIDVDGAPFGTVVSAGVSQPFMFLMSDHSGESDAEGHWIEANFRSLYNQLPRDRTLRITIRGANHFGFSDDLKSPIIMGVMRTLGNRLGGRRQLTVTSHYISTFFDVYLKGAPPSKLQPESAYQEVEYQH